MRDIALTLFIFSILPFIPKRPVVGVLLFTWISLMNPHRLTYGFAYDFPFAAIAAGLTLVSLAMSKNPKRLPMNATVVTLILFTLWITLTTFFAMKPDLAWADWSQAMKMLLMVVVAMMALNTKQDIIAFAWVLGISLGFYGLKGGIFTVASGGTNNVFGPAGTNIRDNNDLALALITTLPIIWYLSLHATHKYVRLGLKGLALMTLIAAVGTYSRGALLAGGAMLFFLWLKRGQKVRNALFLIGVVSLVLMFMPDKWFDRMDTISEYKTDSSAQGRINAWHFAFNVASDKFLGGGFRNFTSDMFMIYAPVPTDVHAPHSIYFQVMGNHGFIGLLLFLLLMLFVWRTGTRIKNLSKGNAELKWAADLAMMLQVSIVGYAVGGAFLSLAYFDLYYDIIALMIILQKFVLIQLNPDKRNVLPTTTPLTRPGMKPS
ncbi:MAG: putative O-glycosylation ligase, exosortase A system-associated [Pseudomonadota bacterium]